RAEAGDARAPGARTADQGQERRRTVRWARARRAAGAAAGRPESPASVVGNARRVPRAAARAEPRAAGRRGDSVRTASPTEPPGTPAAATGGQKRLGRAGAAWRAAHVDRPGDRHIAARQDGDRRVRGVLREAHGDTRRNVDRREVEGARGRKREGRRRRRAERTGGTWAAAVEGLLHRDPSADDAQAACD